MRKSDARIHIRSRLPCLELVLRREDGSPWRLTVSAGMERFIGAYPLVDGLDPGGPLLRFRTADPA